MRRHVMALVLLSPLLGTSVAAPAETLVFQRPQTATRSTGLTVRNGWYVHNNRVVWGFCQHNGWWRAGQRPNLTRNAPGEVRPNRTEDFDKLTDAMLRAEIRRRTRA